MQIIDARDLAAWMLDLAERRVAGAFNGTGPAGMTTMGELLDAAVDATGSDARLPGSPMPRCVAARRGAVDRAAAVGAGGRDGPGTWLVGTGARRRPACAAGRRPRRWPAWEWLRAGGADERGGWGSARRAAPMNAEREPEVLGAV